MIYDINSASSNPFYCIAPPLNCVEKTVVSQYSLQFTFSSSALQFYRQTFTF